MLRSQGDRPDPGVRQRRGPRRRYGEKEAGLGDYERSKIEIVGRFKRLRGFKLPPLGGEAISRNEGAQAMLHSKTLLRPQADPDLCTGCGSCVSQCPASALSMDGKIPLVDPEKCIVCFCCQEICPAKAISLK